MSFQVGSKQVGPDPFVMMQVWLAALPSASIVFIVRNASRMSVKVALVDLDVVAPETAASFCKAL